MVEPFDLELVNPASIDVRLGSHLMIEVADQRDLIEIDISKRTADTRIGCCRMSSALQKRWRHLICHDLSPRNLY